MKKLSAFFALLLMMACTFVACDPTEPSEPPVGDESPCFGFKINNVTKTSVTFTVTPFSDMPYMALIIDKAYFDKFDNEDDYIADDLAWFGDMATYEEKELSVWLEENLSAGTLMDTEEGLVPNTEYYLYAYHMNTYGEVVSDLEKVEFSTEGYDLKSGDFEVSVKDVTYDTAVVDVVPADMKSTYFVNVLSEEDYAYFGGDDMAYVKHLEALRDYYIGRGQTPEAMVANLCFVGSRSLPVNKLSAGKKYYAYALGVDDDFFATTTAEVVTFTTNKPNASTLTFEVDIEEIQYDRAVGNIIPSNSDTYVCSVRYADALDYFEEDESLMNVILEDLQWLYGSVEEALRTGTTDLSDFVGLRPESDYAIICFGWDGAPTTKLFSYEFTTSKADGNPDDLNVRFEATNLGHSDMTVTAYPSVGAYYFFSIIDRTTFDDYVTLEGDTSSAVRAIANREIDFGAEYFDYSRAEYLLELGASIGQCSVYFNQLTPSTDYVAYAVAVDMESGELASQRVSVSEPIRTLDKIVGAAKVEFLVEDYYDGTELAALDAANFNSCKGMAVVPYKVLPNEEAVQWFTICNYGDYTEWNCTDDDIIAELVKYGYEMGSEDVALNSEGGVMVLKYDEPYTFLGIAKDAEGNYGAGTLYVVTAQRSKTSPAEEFIATLPASAPLKAAVRSEKRAESPLMVSRRHREEPRRIVAPSATYAAEIVDQTPAQRTVGKRHLL